MGDHTQALNITLYPHHIAAVDAVSRNELEDHRLNRSRAIQHIIDKYVEMYQLSMRLRPPAASDQRQVGRPPRQEKAR